MGDLPHTKGQAGSWQLPFALLTRLHLLLCHDAPSAQLSREPRQLLLPAAGAHDQRAAAAAKGTVQRCQGLGQSCSGAERRISILAQHFPPLCRTACKSGQMIPQLCLPRGIS